MVVWTQGRQLLHGHLESSCCLEIRFRCLAMFGSWKVHRISQLCFVPSFVMCFFMLLSDPCWSSLLSSQLLWSILSGWVAWLSHQSEHLSACFNPNVGWLHIWLILFQLRRSLSESDLLMLFYIILPCLPPWPLQSRSNSPGVAQSHASDRASVLHGGIKPSQSSKIPWAHSNGDGSKPVITMFEGITIY